MSLSFSTVEVITENNKKYVQKIANLCERQTTIDQIQYIKSLPEHLRGYFPEIIEYHIDSDRVIYTMPYYDMNQLDRSLLDDNIPIEIINTVVIKLVNLMFDKVYTMNINKLNENYAKKVYIERMKKRIRYFIDNHREYKEILEAPTLLINDVEYNNFSQLVNFIERPNIINLISPEFLTMIHGDLEANHILYEVQDNSVQLMLLDPRTNNNGGDLAYDLGKLLQSVHGLSHEIQYGNFYFQCSNAGTMPNIKFNITSMRNINEYTKLQKSIESEIDFLSTKYKIPNCNQRALFAEATHFISAPPYFLDTRYAPNTGIALYIQGVCLLNKFVRNILEHRRLI